MLETLTDSLSTAERVSPQAIVAARSISDLLEMLEDGADSAVVLATKDATSDFWQALSLITEYAPATPLVAVLSASDPDDRVLLSRCLQAGADDMLIQSELSTHFAHRIIQRAIERRRHHGPKRDNRPPVAKPRAQDGSWSRRLYGSDPLAVSERSLGTSDRVDFGPETTADLVREYGDLLDRSLEQQVHWNQHLLTEDVSAFADRLGVLGAGPRDVIEVHKSAMNPKLEEKSSTKTRAYVDEGRLLMLQVMGYLVSFYRRLTWGVPTFTTRQANLVPAPQPKLGDKDDKDV